MKIYSLATPSGLQILKTLFSNDTDKWRRRIIETILKIESTKKSITKNVKIKFLWRAFTLNTSFMYSPQSETMSGNRNVDKTMDTYLHITHR